jgi:hypothetical protein
LIKWIVLSFAIPEILAAGSFVFLSPMLSVIFGDPAVKTLFLHTLLYALIPGVVVSAILGINRLVVGRPPSEPN